MMKAGPVLLEPVMDVDILIPREYLGEVVGDFVSKRGSVEQTEQRGPHLSIKGYAPLSELFGYATAVRSLTQGRGSFSMELYGYEKVPQDIAEKIVHISGRGARVEK
jgi:elongation factor G